MGDCRLDKTATWLRLQNEICACLESDFMRSMLPKRSAFGAKSVMGALDAAVLYSLTKLLRPRIVVETGTHSGMSASFLRQAQIDGEVDNGIVISIDKRSNKDVGMLIPDRLKAGVQFIYGDIREQIRSARIPESIDLYFHDSTHTYYHQLWEYRAFWPKINQGGILVSHDVNMSSGFASFIATLHCHDVNGFTDRSSTELATWGNLFSVGFAQKKIDPVDSPCIT